MISFARTFTLDKQMVWYRCLLCFPVGADAADLMVRLPVGAYSVHFVMRKSSNNYIGENT